MEGWIKLYRKFTDWEWFEISEMVHLFIYLLINANHEDGEWRGIKIKRGQIVTGLNSLNKKTKISIRTLRTCLDKLKKTKEIDIQATNKYSIITICNYESYQNGNTTTDKQTDKQPTSNRQTTDNKQEGKEGKNVKNNIIPEFEEFKKFALENDLTINISALELKYKSWVENNWRDGNNKKIINWKSKILNTIPYLKNNNNGFNQQHSKSGTKRVNSYWDNPS